MTETKIYNVLFLDRLSLQSRLSKIGKGEA